MSSSPPAKKQKDGSISTRARSNENSTSMNNLNVNMQEAPEAASAYEAIIMLPGPFVILQGMPGDGMANTVDTMPLVNVHGMGPLIRRGNNDDTTEFDEEESASAEESFQQVNVGEEEDHSSVLLIGGSTASSDSLEVVNSHGQQQRQSSDENDDSGEAMVQDANRVHFPIPPSAVAGMGYNTLLPFAPSSILGGRGTLHGSSKNNRNNSGGNHPEDSFIVVQSDQPHENEDDSNNGPGINTSSQSNSTHHHNYRSSTSSSNSSSSSNKQFNNNLINITLSREESRAIKNWSKECRARETRQRNEVLMHANPQSGGTTSPSLTTSMSASHGNNQWWQKKGFLCVFQSQPILTDEGAVTTGPIIATLPPGSTVMGTEMTTIDGNDSKESVKAITEITPTKQNNISMGKRGAYQFLKIESPYIGYILFSMDGYSYVGPGLPSYYIEPEIWTWRVTCNDGAYVRQGLELTSVHVDTIPHGSFLRVNRKTVNSMGLSRLRVQSVLKKKDGNEASANHLFCESADNCNEETEVVTRIVTGWVSEALNPLSGQRGPVVQPVPFPIPALYRVTLPDGAVIRADVELSSPEIGHAPLGSILNVIGRAFSEHPMDQCIERLKLAGGGGWVSVRLNRPPPLDELVVEMVGVDGVFDPNEPGVYHLEKQKQVMQEYQDISPNSSRNHRVGNNNNGHCDRNSSIRCTRPLRRVPTTSGDLSSINDEDDSEESSTGHGLGASGELSNNTCSTMSSSAAIPTLYRCGVAGENSGSRRNGRKVDSLDDQHCLICLTEQRTATIVHGETGHIACCLGCARILKARGDRVSSFFVLC